jgi:hypothetical protein
LAFGVFDNNLPMHPVLIIERLITVGDQLILRIVLELAASG